MEQRFKKTAARKAINSKTRMEYSACKTDSQRNRLCVFFWTLADMQTRRIPHFTKRLPFIWFSGIEVAPLKGTGKVNHDVFDFWKSTSNKKHL